MRLHTVPTPDSDHAIELFTRNLLIGGVPGSGKSVPLNVPAATTALTGEQDRPNPASAARTEED
jgi:hypothetical protein